MFIVFKTAFLFVFGAAGGYFLEFFYRGAKTKRAVNPGFLFGPYLPVYGFGVIILQLFCLLDYSFIQNPALRLIFFALCVAAALTLTELIAGVIFIRLLKLRLWDYSNRRLNFKGLICAKLSLVWGAVGVLYYLYLHPPLKKLLSTIENNPALLLLTALIFSLMLIDLFICAVALKRGDYAKKQKSNRY